MTAHAWGYLPPEGQGESGEVTTHGLPISVSRPTTKYETKARDAGSAVAELLWKRCP
jgi:tRNA G46 methylase TrmB